MLAKQRARTPATRRTTRVAMLAVAATRPLRPRPQLSITNSGPWAYAYSSAFIRSISLSCLPVSSGGT
jgi:hypothetical protein